VGDQEQKERRKYKRFPFREDILIDNIMKAYSQNISQDGMFLCTANPPEKDSIITVTIPLKLTVKAVVRNYQPGIGTGIKFIDMTDDQKILIKQLIEEIKPESEKTQSKEKQILLIEDNEVSRKIHKTLLVENGFAVVEARDGIEGIKLLEEYAPALIILDLYMENMDGFKVLSILKSTPKWENISVLIFSARITQDVIDKLISHTFPLSQIQEALELSASRQCAKIILKPWE
jgi:CheY-like chemotaxis protein